MEFENRKDQIIQTSAILFKEKGFSAVTMRDIAKAMGIKAASLYNHISSKQEILSNIIISLAEEFTEGMNNILSEQICSVDKLKKIIELHVNVTSKNQFGMASLNSDWMHLNDSLDYYLSLRKNYEDNFRSIIKKGIQDNELVKSNPDIILFSILSTLRSLYIWIPDKKDLEPQFLANELKEVLLKGITK